MKTKTTNAASWQESDLDFARNALTDICPGDPVYVRMTVEMCSDKVHHSEGRDKLIECARKRILKTE